MDDPTRDLEAKALLAASRDTVRARRLAEVGDLEVLAQWAALHSWDPTEGPDGAHMRRIGHVLRSVGGDGTPLVQDFCLGEIAMARGTGVTAAVNALADVLDLQHRMPLTWAVCTAGDCEIYIARRAAKLSRHLPADKMWVVDQAVARMIAHEAGGRTLAVVEAKIIEADPEAHQARVTEEEQRRFVGFSRIDQLGLQMIYARLSAGDAAALRALLELVADILTPTHPDLCRDELRSIAFGYLARPAQLIRLILEHLIATNDPSVADLLAPTTPSTVVEPVETTPEAVEDPGLEPQEEPEPQEPEEPVLHSAIAFPADLLEALKVADWSAWAPKCDLYVHLHQHALAGRDAVARIEGLGPVGLAQLQTLLGRADLTVKPVLDLSDRIRTTAYEHPESLKERIHLITGGDYWPYATSVSRKVDHDHPTPYVPPDDGGPPGQTGTHNSGPLGRRHHRWKTHAGYRARQCGQGRYVLTTPHGLAYLRDHRGTRPLDPDQARQIIDAGPGVDLYFPPDPDLHLEIDL